MPKRRRSATEALDVPVKIQEFITKGLPNTQDSDPTSGPLAINDPQVAVKGVSENNSNWRERPKHRRTRQSKNTPKRSSDQTISEDVSRAYAKATIQKTVRFRPEIVAELDALVREEEATGKQPKSFQQIQNEALAMWIKARAT